MNKSSALSTGPAILMAILMGISCTKNSTGDNFDDQVPPSAIEDLHVTSFTANSVVLSWTATGDDSTSGTAAQYDLRYGKNPINQSNWESLTEATGIQKPEPAGSTEWFAVSDLMEDTTYYFAVKARDEAGNGSEPSNCVSAICLRDSIVVFHDPGLDAAVRERLAKPVGNIHRLELMQIPDLSATSGEISDLSGIQAMTGLKVLRLRDNKLTDLSPLVSLTELESLDVSHNSLEDIAVLQYLNNLDSVSVAANEITDISPFVENIGLSSGDQIDLVGNPLSHESVRESVPTLRSRGIIVYWPDDVTPPNDVTSLRAYSGDTWVRLTWAAPGDDYDVGTAFAYDMRYAHDTTTLLDWNSAIQVTGEPTPGAAGAFQEMTVTELTSGTRYYFGLRTRDESDNWSNTSNVVLGIPFVEIIVTFYDANLELAVRWALYMPSEDLTPTKLRAVTNLWAPDMRIESLSGLEYCVNLRKATLRDNLIRGIGPLSGLTELRYLSLRNNVISDISPLANLVLLDTVQLSGNNIGTLSPLSNLTALLLVEAINCGISDVGPLASLLNLQHLSMGSNPVSEVSPLAGLTNLESVYLDHCQITDISAFSGMVNIQTLDLQSNLIEDISPLLDNSGLGVGDTLNLELNPLSDESVDVYLPLLQARGVTVLY